MSKPKLRDCEGYAVNGHDKGVEAKTYSQSPSAIRMRRYRDRKKRGATVLKSLLIEPDLISALTALSWLHPSERGSREAVETALNALILHSLNFGATPQKPSVPVDLQTVEAAWIWAKRGAEPTPENAGRAIRTAIVCAKQAGFGPETYASTMRQRLGIN